MRRAARHLPGPLHLAYLPSYRGRNGYGDVGEGRIRTAVEEGPDLASLKLQHNAVRIAQASDADTAQSGARRKRASDP